MDKARKMKYKKLFKNLLLIINNVKKVFALISNSHLDVSRDFGFYDIPPQTPFKVRLYPKNSPPSREVGAQVFQNENC
jgi:hypothetical protein